MNRNAINPRYKTRLQPVLDHIRGSLDQPLRLESLAEKAHFSPFHFHRIFRAVMGETVNAHIRRLRMEKAYLLLTASAGCRIVDVAVACGYASQSTFSRDFKQYFAITPSQLRRGRHAAGKVKLQHEESEVTELSVQVETLDEIPVISRTRMGAYDFRIGMEWVRLMLRARSKRLLQPDSKKVGLIYDDPDITPAGKCRFDATISVSATDAERYIPSGQYAVVDYRESFSRLGSVIDNLYGSWLVRSGYYPAEGPIVMDFDEHLHDFRRFRLCVPVSPFG